MVKVLLPGYLFIFYYFLLILTSFEQVCEAIGDKRHSKYSRIMTSSLARSLIYRTSLSKGLLPKLGAYTRLMSPESSTSVNDESQAQLRNNNTFKRSLLSYASPRTLDICNTEECEDASHFLLRSINFDVDPCDDFFEFTCGRWIQESPIPPTASAWSYNGLIEQHVDRITRGILMTPVEPSDPKPLRQAKEFHSLCTNTAALEKRGLLPILKILERYGGWPLINMNWKEENFKLMETIADIHHVYSSFLAHAILFKVGVEEDLKDTTRRIIFFDQTSFSLGRTILLNPKRYKHRHTAYKTYFIKVAQAFANFVGENVTDAELTAQVEDVITLETMLALASSSDENRTNYERMYNPKTLSAWQRELDAVPLKHKQPHARMKLKAYLDHTFSTSGVAISMEENLQVYEPEYFSNLLRILDVTPARTVATLVLWRLVDSLISETTESMRLIQFEYEQVIYGIEKPVFREWLCPDKVVSQGFGMALASKFIETEEFTDAELKEVDGLVENIRGAFVKRLDEDSSWMDNVTRMATVGKIKAITKFLGYPKWIFNKTRMNEEFRGFELVRGNYFQSAIALSQWFLDEHFKSLRMPQDKNQWHIHPGVVNAFYYPQSNSIHMPAAYMSSPRYVMGGPEALNYGGLGSILGHELTHSLDIEGSQFDKEGNFKNWASPYKIPDFLSKANCLIEQYNGFVTPAGRINGRLTLSENIADNGGLRQAFRAYTELLQENDGNLKGQRLPRLEHFSPEQLFFVGYGINWCSSMRKAELENHLIEFHSPPKYRVWGAVQNSVEFANSFRCPRGSPMNPIRKRCTLW